MARHDLLFLGTPGASGSKAAQFVARHRTGTSTASATSRTLTALQAVPVGNLFVVTGSAAVAASKLNTVTDPRGNTWTVIQTTTPGGNIVYLAFTVVTNAISANDTITLTFNAAHTRWAAEMNEWTNALALDVYVTNTGTSTTTPTSAASGTLSRPGELAIAVFGLDSAGTTQQETSHSGPFANLAFSTQGATTGAGDTAAIQELTLASCLPIGTSGATAGFTIGTGKAYGSILATFVTAPTSRGRRFFENPGLVATLTPFRQGPTTAVLDDFMRGFTFGQVSDETPLQQLKNGAAYGPGTAAQWSLLSATGEDLRILTNVAAHGATGTGTGRRYRNAAALSSLGDQEAYFTVSTKAGNGDGYGVLTRLHDVSLDTWDGYELMALAQSGTDTVELRRIDNGTATVLATYNQEHVAGDMFMLRSVGSTHEVWYFNSSQVSPFFGSTSTWTKLGQVTDSTYTAGPIGLSIKNTTARVDDFGGGPVTKQARGRRFFENSGLTQVLDWPVFPTIVDAKTTTSGIPTVTTKTVTLTNRVAIGDIIFLTISWFAGPGTVTPPSGFTEISNQISGRFRIYQKTATAADATATPPSYTFSWTNSRNMVLQCVVYRDVDGIDTSSSFSDSSAISTHTTGTVTANRRNAPLVMFNENDDGINTLVATGWTEELDQGTGGGGEANEVMDIFPDLNPSSTTSGLLGSITGTKGPFTFTTTIGERVNNLTAALATTLFARRRGRRFLAAVNISDSLKIVGRNIVHRRRDGFRRVLAQGSNSATSLALTLDYTPDKPGCVLVAVSWFAGGTNPTVSDSKGNTYTQDASLTTGARYSNIRVFRTDNAQGLVAGDTITISQSPTGTDKSAIAIELEAVDGSVAPLQVSTVGGASGAVTASITESEADEMVLAICTSEATNNLTRNIEGFALETMPKIGTLQMIVANRDEGIYETTQSPSVTFSGANTGQPVAVLLGFRQHESLMRDQPQPATTFSQEVLTDSPFWYLKLDENPAGPPATSLLDNFNRANETPLSTAGMWSLQSSGATANLASNQVAAAGNANPILYFTDATYAADQEAWLTVSEVPTGGTAPYIAVCCRYTDNGGGSFNGYHFRAEVQAGGTTANYIIYRFTNGGGAALASANGVPIAAGDKILGRARGTGLELWRYDSSNGTWSVVISATDGTYTTSASLGFGIRGTTSGKLDDFGGGALPAGLSTAVDSSGNGHDGTYIGTLLQQGQPPLTREGYSVRFTGSGSVRIGNIHVSDRTKLTIEAWARVNGLSQNGKIVGKHSSTSDVEGTIGVNAGRYTWELNTGGTYHLLNSNTFVDEQRHQIVGTYDGSTMKLYIDGQLDASVAASGNTAQSTTNWDIAAIDGGNNFSGYVSRAVVYNADIGAARVKAHFDAGIRDNGPPGELITEVQQLSQQSVVDMINENPGAGNPNTSDDLYISNSATLTMDEATVEPVMQLTQTVSDSGSIAELGDTYTLTTQLTDAITAQKILESALVSAQATLSMITTGDESDPFFLQQTSLVSLIEQINGSIFDVFRMVQTLSITLEDVIRSDIETLTVEQTGAQSLIEGWEQLTLSQTSSLSMSEFIPQTIDTLTLTQTDLVIQLEDAEVVKLSQTNTQLELAATELANLVQTAVVSLGETIVTPGSGFNENLNLAQQSLISLQEIINVWGIDDIALSQTNVLRIAERILQVPTSLTDLNGIEFDQIILPYSSSTYTLASTINASQTTITLTNASGLPSGGFVLTIGSEQVYVVSRDGNTLTVIRGWGGTGAEAHGAGSTVTWSTDYTMTMACPQAASAGEWITMHDATQAYLDGARYAFHVAEFTFLGQPGGPNKLDGPQPWRSSPDVGVTDAVPCGTCQPARLAQDCDATDIIQVRYSNNVAPSGTFELGPRILLPQFWTDVIGPNAFHRFDDAGNLDDNNPNANIYDGKTTSSMVYTDSASLIRARELGADRYWTVPVADGGRGKGGINVGVLVLRNGHDDIPSWYSLDWHNGDYRYMGFDDPDAMFIQVVYKTHYYPDSVDIYGPNAHWDTDGFMTSTSYAMFTTLPRTPIPGSGDGEGSGPGGGSGGGGGGIKHQGIGVHIWVRY
jgi:hypothetical protein